MELIFFISGIFILLLYLVYVFIRDQRHQPQQSLGLLTLELSESRAEKQRLREELNSLQDRLQATLIDPVTHLIGWQLFEDRLVQCMKDSARNHLSFSIIQMDLDHFKMINHALGYDVGDLLLKAVAERLQTCVRQVDSVSRFSKDTFVLLLAQLNKPETTVLITQRLLQAFTLPFQIKTHELYLTVSMGIAVYPMDGEEASILLRNAEQALFLAKEKNGNSYQFYQPTLQLGSQRELTLHLHLNQESLFQELNLYYQPIMNVSQNSVFCMDTDLHWQHAEFGLIDQQELFDYAVKQRKLNSISEWLLRRAIQQFIHWRSLGFSPDCFSITVLVDQLENSHFVYSISQILQELQCQPEWMLLKIVGHVTHSSADILEKSFNMLHYLKIKMALADYDSDTFSLRQLKVFPIHYLMLSSLYIEDIHLHARTAALVKAIILLAQTMSMQVIVRGVECEQQFQVLKELGCTLMQGILLGTPLPENEVTAKMVATTA